MNSCIFVFAAVLTLNGASAFAATTVVEYAAYEKPSSLAGGKVLLKYDDEGSVSELRMYPDPGETLSLEGENFVFAPGARVFSAQGGVSSLPSGFAASGSVQFGVTNLSWSSRSLLPEDGYEVLFRDVRLEDITPLSGTIRAKAYDRFVDQTAKPFWIRRSGDTMDVQFQLASEQFTQAVRVELKQVGDDVCGKIVKAGYNKAGNWSLGYDHFYDPKITITHYDVYASEHVEGTKDAPVWGYGVSALAAGPRRDTYVFSEKFLSDEYDVMVASDVLLEELEFICAACGHNKKVKGIPRDVMLPRNVKCDGGVLSAQFQIADEGLLKCARVELRQSGPDVVARIGYARYAEGADLGTDLDVAGAGVPYDVMTEEKYTPSAYGYSVDMLALRRKSRNRIRIPVAGTLDVDYEMKGSGTAVAFEPGSDGAGAVTVNFKSAADGMTDSSFMIGSGGTGPVTANVINKNALPGGTTEVYGDSELWLSASTVFADGISHGKSEIVMRPGSRLYHNGASVIRCQNQPIVLDAAELLIRYHSPYLNDLTLKNGACIAKDMVSYVQAGHVADICRWRITGERASTNNLDVVLVAWGRNADGKATDLTVDVEDVTCDEGADFVMNGGFSVLAGYPNSGLIKSGAGTMRLNGSISAGGRTTCITGGTLMLGVSAAVSDGIDLSLQGGTLAAAAGTENAVKTLFVSEDSSVKMESGASLRLKNLIVDEGVTLEIASPRPNTGVIVQSALDVETVKRIRINGHECTVRDDGTLSERTGMAVLVR